MTTIPVTGFSSPPLVMGGAGFSYQLHSDPGSLPITEILLRAFELGVRSIDTSPYYEPSEQLMGAALAHADVKAKYNRGDYEIMTKVGRINENEFDYSPDCIHKSVARSLERFQTPHLDVVFCHDVEFVPKQDVITAVGVLFDIQRSGLILSVGISGYYIDVLVEIAAAVLERIVLGSTITGVSSISDLEQNVAAAKEILKDVSSAGSEVPESLRDHTELDQQTLERNAPLFEQARSILGEWIDYDFSSQKNLNERGEQ
ncbi:l-galactose dehydrogenase [Colletotrichum kahawae]|uniref:L-galactose dehydrogenase n=1 Tax=Colletotrichum kahawae TaxID=34407 RepID=A0AAE0D359_COLKA|nr:l-galactose dehydrogenase [Colletotrichum kahawae]